MGEPRNMPPASTRTMCEATMYRAQRISGHPISAMRIVWSGSVRAPVRRLAAAVANIRQSANAMYDGTTRTLKAIARTRALAEIQSRTADQSATTGSAAAAHTTVSTMTINTSVTPTRHTTAADTRTSWVRTTVTATPYERHVR